VGAPCWIWAGLMLVGAVLARFLPLDMPPACEALKLTRLEGLELSSGGRRNEDTIAHIIDPEANSALAPAAQRHGGSPPHSQNEMLYQTADALEI
jgi:hypothetical protein